MAKKKKEAGSFWDYIVSDTKKRAESGKDSFISTVDKIVGQPGATRKALKTKPVLEQANKDGSIPYPRYDSDGFYKDKEGKTRRRPVSTGGITISSTSESKSKPKPKKKK
jgi:hypothetical protein